MDKDASIRAADIAKEKTKKALKRYKVTEGVVAKRLREALDAKEVKVFNDKADGIVYSNPLIAHHIRIKAIEIAVSLLEMEPSKKIEFPDENGNPQKVGGVIVYMPDNKRD